MQHHTQVRVHKAIRNVNRQSSMPHMLAAAALFFAFAQAEADQLTVTAANWLKNSVYNIQINSSTSTPPTPVIPGTTTAINSDAGQPGNFNALVWVTNSYCNSRDLIVANASKGAIERYRGASTVTSTNCYNPTPVSGKTTPTISPTAQTVFAYATGKSGPQFPNGLSADAYGNVFVISSAIAGSYAGVWALPFNAMTGDYNPPVLIDKTFGGTKTTRLVETVVAGSGATTGGNTVLWHQGDLLVLIDDWTSTKNSKRITIWSPATRVVGYAATSIYGNNTGTPGPISSSTVSPTVAIPTTAFVALFNRLKITSPGWSFFSLFSDAVFGMDLLPATPPSTDTQVLFTIAGGGTSGGTISTFDSATNQFLTTDYATNLGLVLQRVKVGLFSNVPYAFVTQVLSGSKLQGQILVLGAPISGKNNVVGFVTSGVMEPVGLAVVESGSVPVPQVPNGTPFTLAPLGTNLLSMQIDNLGTGTFSGVSTQSLCTMIDPRVNATVTSGVLTSWNCTALGSPTPDLQIGAGTPYCSALPTAYIPGSVCAHSGAGANALAVVEGAATGLDAFDNNTIIAITANADTALPGPGNLECTAFSATGQIPLMAYGTRSDLTTVEGVIAEDTVGIWDYLGLTQVLGGQPGYLTELTGGCDNSSTGGRGNSLIAFGIGLSTPPSSTALTGYMPPPFLSGGTVVTSAAYQTFVYQLLAQKFAALNQTIATAKIVPSTAATLLETDIGSASGAQFFVNEAQSNVNVTANMNCALSQIYKADSDLRTNLPDFFSNLITTPPGGGNPNPGGEIDGRLANLFLNIYTEFLGNVPPAPQAPPNFLIPPGLVTGCTLMPPPYSVGGTVTGLAASATVTLVNQSNLDSTTVTGGGTGTDSFTFPADLNAGAAYNIAVTMQPNGQTCSSNNASGSIVEGNVGNVVFNCSANVAPSMSITYYTISPTDPDPGTLSFASCTDYVTNTLGMDGLPILNTNATDCGTSLAKDVNSSTGEILWWSPSYTGNMETGAPVPLPYTNSAFFPPNGGGNCDGGGTCPNGSQGLGFQAAVLSGQLNVTDPGGEQVTFSITVDDMAFVYVDGTYVCGLGGVQAATSTACTTSIMGGTHNLEVFYVDMNVVGAVLFFNVSAPSIVVTPGGG